MRKLSDLPGRARGAPLIDALIGTPHDVCETQ